MHHDAMDRRRKAVYAVWICPGSKVRRLFQCFWKYRRPDWPSGKSNHETRRLPFSGTQHLGRCNLLSPKRIAAGRCLRFPPAGCSRIPVMSPAVGTKTEPIALAGVRKCQRTAVALRRFYQAAARCGQNQQAALLGIGWFRRLLIDAHIFHNHPLRVCAGGIRIARPTAAHGQV